MSVSEENQRKEVELMDFLCSICGKREEEPRGWRFVVELEKPGTSIRNTIILVDEWDGRKAHDPHASCFCSRECEERYLAVRHHELVA